MPLQMQVVEEVVEMYFLRHALPIDQRRPALSSSITKTAHTHESSRANHFFKLLTCNVIGIR